MINNILAFFMIIIFFGQMMIIFINWRRYKRTLIEMNILFKRKRERAERLLKKERDESTKEIYRAYYIAYGKAEELTERKAEEW